MSLNNESSSPDDVPESTVLKHLAFATIVAWVSKACINLLVTNFSMEARCTLTFEALELDCGACSTILAWFTQTDIALLCYHRIWVTFKQEREKKEIRKQKNINLLPC